jgi:hypothetical protein
MRDGPSSKEIHEVPWVQKRVVAYRRTYHAHVRDKLVCRYLKKKCLIAAIKAAVGDMEDLEEVWESLDTSTPSSSSGGTRCSSLLLIGNFTPY